MLVLRDPASASSIADPEIRGLVEQLFVTICDGEPYEYDLHGYMIVVEPGDSVEALEKESSCPILRNRHSDARFGDPTFSPSFEFVAEHSGCYEAVYVLSDSGFGVDFFIPKTGGIDAELLALCARYAEPSPELTGD